MAIRVRGLNETITRFKRRKRAGSKAAREGVAEAAEAIQQRAVAQAPIDEGSLESAIKFEEYKTFFTFKARVYVDGSVIGKYNKPVGQYAVIMHESLTPFGDMQLGEKSVAKQEQANDGVEVGGGYLTRAREDLKPELMKALDKKIKNAVKKK